MAEILKVFQPSKYYSIFIGNAVRPDGRQLATFGPTSVNVNCISSANGSALINLRETTVLCGIKAELTNPSSEEPRKGYIIPNVDFPPVCSRRFMPGPPCDEAQVYTQLVANLLKDSLIIDPEDLCISEGKLCWCLYIDITCLNYGGNALDACILSMIAAAQNTTLPEVSTPNDSIQVSSEKIPLKVRQLLFSSTFAVFDNGIVADPTVEEEELSSSLISVITREDGIICNIIMGRGGVLSEACIKQCIQQAKKRSKKLTSLIKNMQASPKN